MVVLGAHDLNSMESQHVPVKAVYSRAYDGSFPPLRDLALLYLSVPARLGIRPHPRPQDPNPGARENPFFGLLLAQINVLHFRKGC